jgi:uncharacterized protein (TIGR03067 family)
MKTHFVPKLALLMLPVLLAADAPSTGDLAQLQGDWTVNAGPKKDIPVTLSVHGDQASVDFASPLGLKIQTTNPKTIDWVGFSIVDGQDFPDILGIYELNPDSFRMVNGGMNDRRPKEFKKGDGVLADVLVFTRPGTSATKTKDSSVKPTNYVTTSYSVAASTLPVPVVATPSVGYEVLRARPVKSVRQERRVRRQASRQLAMVSR